MPKATLTALAWHQSWILWGFVYAVGLVTGYWLAGGIGVLSALAVLSSYQVIRAYAKLGGVLRQRGSLHRT